MIAIITDNIPAAKVIACVLGISGKKDGYMQGGGYLLLCTGTCPVAWEHPREQTAGLKDLPLKAGSLRLAPRRTETKKGRRADSAALRLLETIRGVFSRCERIIVATDPSGEGELAFRYIYAYLVCTKPFARLWARSLDEQAVRQGIENPVAGSLYDSLYLSAMARDKAAYLMEINAGAALRACTGREQLFPGWMQLPVLAMVCKRYREVGGFKPRPYTEASITVSKGDRSFRLAAAGRFDDPDKAEDMYRHLRTYPAAKVTAAESHELHIGPPLPYDLPALQKEAALRLGIDAALVQHTARELYSMGLATYPQTTCRHITRELFGRMPQLIESLKGYPPLEKQAVLLSVMKLNGHCVDVRKATSHHGIVITGNKPGKLTARQEGIYTLVAGRMLEALAPACIKDVLEIEACCDDIVFPVSRASIRKEGWRAFSGAEADSQTGAGRNEGRPELLTGDYLRITGCSLVQKKTKAPLLFTCESLLSAMEEAGKGAGIAQLQDRVSIIAALVKKGYIAMQGKDIVPTEKGLGLYSLTRNMGIAGEDTAAAWDKGIRKIETDPASYGDFMETVSRQASQAVDEIVSIAGAKKAILKTPYICPRCRLGKITFYERMTKCAYSKCNLTLFRRVCGKKLTAKQLDGLFRTGKSPLVKGFRDKQGELFEAHLAFNRNGGLRFGYPRDKQRKDKCKCTPGYY
ncbi:topoisomerase C-terminal repeat-containing protein [Dysgonomonas sp. GY75]|uniref:type IA DNA topoisomerase n=1 Tax=Dysgonomonas sp. GY75 TaxID=2780419 RepID=UPI00188323F5|nr:type IA DNA topoisomerase [Dysgonomonas sp. GY75]MBF0651539.1 topoisomerase C-terminal repeat-containing protein [Dysgonomonas sp. GY75]